MARLKAQWEGATEDDHGRRKTKWKWPKSIDTPMFATLLCFIWNRDDLLTFFSCSPNASPENIPNITAQLLPLHPRLHPPRRNTHLRRRIIHLPSHVMGRSEAAWGPNFLEHKASHRTTSTTFPVLYSVPLMVDLA